MDQGGREQSITVHLMVHQSAADSGPKKKLVYIYIDDLLFRSPPSPLFLRGTAQALHSLPLAKRLAFFVWLDHPGCDELTDAQLRGATG